MFYFFFLIFYCCWYFLFIVTFQEEDSDEKGSTSDNDTKNIISNHNNSSNTLGIRSSSPTPSQSGIGGAGNNSNKTQDSLPPLPPTIAQQTIIMPFKETIKFANPEILYHFPEDSDPPPSQVFIF